jgi:DnaK suppressor protein
MNGLTDKQVQDMRDRLEEEKAALERHFEINGSTGDTLTKDTSGELSAYDNHPADSATETFERERDHAIDESFDQKLTEVDAAMQRIEEGTYGSCELCQEPIGYERLEALPWAATCVEHAGLTEGASRSTDVYEMTAPLMPDDADTWDTFKDYGTTDVDAPDQRNWKER